MQSLRDILYKAKQDKTVIWHFNVGSYEHLQAIVSVATELHEPIIIGLSEGERDYIDLETVCHIARKKREQGIPLFVNADHTHSLENIQEAVYAGCDAVLFDAGKETLEENILHTQAVVAWVRAYNQEHQTDVLVEGEMGYIGSGSIVRNTLPSDLSTLTDPTDVVRFVQETEVDLVAPAVGNVHGIVPVQPKLDIERIQKITSVVSIPLVLHGGSGISLDDLSHAGAAGITIIHISTELRVAWKETLDRATQTHKEEIVPYVFLRDIVSGIRDAILKKIR